MAWVSFATSRPVHISIINNIIIIRFGICLIDPEGNGDWSLKVHILVIIVVCVINTAL
jgi:hypothetical protein